MKIPTTMRAMVLERPGEPLRLWQVPVPRPARHQVLIRVHACAVCRTDLHIADGELPKPKLPLIGSLVALSVATLVLAVFAKTALIVER
jgi:propanol-preferring alcohol dehydrogenase